MMHNLLIFLVLYVTNLSNMQVIDQVDEEMSLNGPISRAVAALSRNYNTACTGSSENSKVMAGVCLGRLQCQKEGGTNIGSCGILGICCAVERSCFTSSALKVSYFVNPSDATPKSCNFNVEIQNQAICQVRLDFERFHVAQPTVTTINSTLEWYLCDTERFYVTSPYSNHLGFRYLCGNNNGQHMYIPANSTTAMNYLVLNMQLASNSRASWRIKVTQLECHTWTAHWWALPVPLLSALHGQLHGLGNTATARDVDIIAPPGCLQYYVNPTGIFESFNYDKNVGKYLPELNYAVCFKRYPDTCQISYSFQDFRIGADTDADNYTNTGCDGNMFNDYLYIPSVSDTDQGVKYCGDQTTLPTQVSNSPGPLQVQFHSKILRATIFQQNGFKIQYTIQSC